ncbi:stage 0 sporulation family protein [Eubacteriales bacterium OttesenSCG-928-N14]|nr:stage 0 sporulation family protein [Eubacteriales bacterium OttesenSCG-928-N14]
MKTVVGIKFKKTNKIYYFNPGDYQLQMGDGVIVETARGMEYGEVVAPIQDVEEDKIVAPLKNVVRKASSKDLSQIEKNKQLEKDAQVVFEQKIANHKLEMKAVDVEYAFDASKIVFYFTADGRVDFRELVKDMAQHFRTRIELRQIGIRDEAKMLGGLGKCGCEICCKRFLTEFSPVSIKMAKEQNISLNPAKISGLCGRLMCCLNYEQDYYREMNKKLPRINAVVRTPDGSGTAVENNPITARVKVKLEKPDGSYEFRDYALDELKFDRRAKVKKEEDILPTIPDIPSDEPLPPDGI